MMFVIAGLWVCAFFWGLATAKATAAHYATIAVALLLLSLIMATVSYPGYSWRFEMLAGMLEFGLVNAAIGLGAFGVGHLPRSIFRRVTQRRQPVDAGEVFG